LNCANTRVPASQKNAIFLEHLGLKRAEADIADVSRTDIVAFRDSLYGRKLAPDTVNRYIKILRMLFKAAHRDRFVLENPVEHVEPVKYASNARRRPFTIPEIQAVLAVADPEWQSLIKFGLYSGQRLGDLALLTWSNIDLARDELRLVTRKTGKRLTIPLAQPLREHIEALGASDSPEAPLHPRAFEAVSKKGRAVSVSNAFVELLAQAGLRERHTHESRGIGRNAKRLAAALSFHSLRHTAVTLLKEAGIPQAAVQELIGHTRTRRAVS
jgi:integrase